MDKKRCPGCMKEIAQPVCPHCDWSAYDQNAPHQLPVGIILNDKYIVGRALGQGGFGITYLGWDKYLEQRVAIKEYYPSGSVMRESEVSTVVASYGGALATRYQRNKERFLREAQILARFNEEKEIVHVSNMFEANNTAYFVMEFVDGITLKQHVKNSGGTLGIKETFALLKPVMNALEKLHKAGLVHRDISPDNIMLLPGGGVKLIDFGAVRNVGNADQEMPLTKSTEAILKQGYAPIEQYQNRGSLGPWTDVYALCATILYCLTGEVPPDAPERLLTEAPLEIGKRIPKLSAHQAAVLERGMAMHPRDRIASMSELQKQLFSPIAKIAPPPPPKKEEEPAPQPKKRKWLIPAVALLAVVVIALAVVFTQPKEEEPSPTVPETEPVATAEPTEPTGPVITGIPAEDNILMSDNLIVSSTDDSNSGYPTYLIPEEAADIGVFGSKIRREAVVTLTFHDTLAEAPEDTWDVSQNQNGCVLAWTVQEGSYYNLHIGAEGGVYAPEDSSGLFAFYRNLEHLNLNNAFHTENVTDMSWMFYGLEAIEELDLCTLDTSNVKDLSYFLANCPHLTSLNISSLDTSNVTNMSHSFALGLYLAYDEDRYLSQYIPGNGFLNQEELDAYYAQVAEDHTYQDFITTAVHDYIFLTSLDISKLDTRNVTDMQGMFYGLSSLTELDVSTLDTSNVTDMGEMFAYCASLTGLDLRNFDTSRVTDMNSMFSGCRNIETLDLRNFDTSQVTDMSGMFGECRGLAQLDISSFDTSMTSDMSAMFCYCTALSRLDVSHFDTSNVTDMSAMFSNCEKLTALDVSNFNTSNVRDMSLMFSSCNEIRKLDLRNFDTHNVTHMDGMFNMAATSAGLSKLVSLDISSFDTSNVTDMQLMFYLCPLTSLDLSHFNTSNVTNMSSMFHGCSNLRHLDISSFETHNVKDMSYMFSAVPVELVPIIDEEKFDTSNVVDSRHFHLNYDSGHYAGVDGWNPGYLFDDQEVE